MSTEAIVVPVIDLANFPAELENLAAAATGLGCFRVVNHGMSATLQAEMKAVGRSLFDMPLEVKLLNVNEKIFNGGYIPLEKLHRLMESTGIYDAASPADVHSFCSLMKVSPRQRETINEYVAYLHEVVMEVACKVAESLGLVGYTFQEWTCDARFHRYDFTLEENIGSIVLCGHTDSGFLTILQEDECVSGLEIMNANGDFVAIDPVLGTLLVLIGDMGKVLSNGRLHNVMHRVVCKKAIPRIPIIMFLLGPKDDFIEPEASFIDSDHPRLFQKFKFTEYKKVKNSSLASADEILPLFKEE